ncbi:MAG: phosphate acetyltransferase [Candidatus Cloacimonetes bacterium]|nr:phosphate acetyltransferase [Candidatus Cloacimonadota bacterium]
MNIIKQFRESAAKLNGCVVLPEVTDKRTLKATEQIIREKIGKVILVGNPVKINQQALEAGVNIAECQIIEPESHEAFNKFADDLYQRRKHKGVSLEEATALMKDSLYFGAMLVKFGYANGMVAGAQNTTATVLRAALQTVGVEIGLKTVSSTFIMIVPEFEGKPRVYFFADCAVVPAPDAMQLADIALSTAKTYQKLMLEEPKVAMLSFSTRGSANHELVDKVRDACDELKKRKVTFAFDGEMQFDSAIVPAIAGKKAPDSNVAGQANVLIFPDLQAGNITYKAVQRLAGAEAVGPIIQGLAAPICDLSRGCSVDDIVNTTAMVLLMSVKG